MSPAARGSVLSLVERGWSGARQLSLQLAGRRVGVLHWVKGRVPGDVLRMIEPRPGLAIVTVPRALYRLTLPPLLLWLKTVRRTSWILIDNERTVRQLAPLCRVLGLKTALIREDANGYGLWHGDERLNPDALP